MKAETVKQYQMEERSLIATRAKSQRARLDKLFSIMVKDKLSDDEKVSLLKEELSYHHKTNDFDACKNMGEVVLTNVNLILKKEFKQSI